MPPIYECSKCKAHVAGPMIWLDLRDNLKAELCTACAADVVRFVMEKDAAVVFPSPVAEEAQRGLNPNERAALMLREAADALMALPWTSS